MSVLERFVHAQSGGVYERALAELRAGSKRSHWMWYVFPQIAGLGLSETSRFYAIRDRAEAQAYLAHDVLGPRLLECCNAVHVLENTSAERIFGGIDATKLRSSLTLFEAVSAGPVTPEPVFADLLDQYFDGERDAATLAKL